MSQFCKPTVVCSQSRAIKEQQCIALNSFVSSLKASLVHCCTYLLLYRVHMNHSTFVVVDVIIVNGYSSEVIQVQL